MAHHIHAISKKIKDNDKYSIRGNANDTKIVYLYDSLACLDLYRGRSGCGESRLLFDYEIYQAISKLKDGNHNNVFNEYILKLKNILFFMIENEIKEIEIYFG